MTRSGHRSILDALIAAVVPSFLVLVTPGRAQFTNKITTTPAIIQDGQGPAGDSLPYDGLLYCCPTAVSMSLAYLGVNGFNQLGPSSPTAAADLNLVRIMSGLMYTDALAGTSSNADISNAIELLLAAKGIGTSSYSLTYQQSPTVASLEALNRPGTVVDLVCGEYSTSDSRIFGHCVSLLAAGVNAKGQPVSNGLVIDNPEPSVFAPQADLPASDPQSFNTTATSGVLTGNGAIQLDPNQYAGFWGTNRLVIETAIALTINPNQETAKKPALAPWTISGAETINLNGGTLPVLAPIRGAGGISTNQGGILELLSQDTSTGANSASGATLRSYVATGTPFGTGSILVQSGALELTPVAGTTAARLTVAGGAGGALTFSDAARLELDAAAKSTLALTIGGNKNGKTQNLVCNTANYGTLVIAPNDGVAAMGTTEKLLVSGSGGDLPTVSDGIVSPAIVAENNDTAGSGDFLGYGANGFVEAAYKEATSIPIAKARSAAVYEANAPETLGANVTADVHALAVDGVTVSGATGSVLEVGSLNGGQAGVILNGGTISVPTLKFGAAQGLVYSSKAGGSIHSVIGGTAGLVAFGPGTLTLEGANTYTGVTIVDSGTLDAANATGSATSSGSVLVEKTGTLEITGAKGKAGGAGGITVHLGGALLLNGGTAAGPLTVQPGSHLFGSGTISGTAAISGTIGGSADDLYNAPYKGVEDLAFSGPSTTFNSQTIYSWRLNALTDTPTEAGIDYSLLKFTNPKGVADMGTSGNAFNFAFDLGTGLNDPNSGAAFWNLAHKWVAAEDLTGFNNIWYHYDFPTFKQGDFSLSTDSAFKYLYVDYTPTPGGPAAAATGSGTLQTDSRPVPEAATGFSFALGVALFGCRRRRRVQTGSSESTDRTISLLPRIFGRERRTPKE